MKLYIPAVVLTIILLAVLFAALNYRQLYSFWSIKSETKRLVKQAESAPDDFQNPPAVQDNFQGRLSKLFWNFSIINGGGKVNNGDAWHAASYAVNDMLAIYHFSDASFAGESSDLFAVPAAGRYNNVTLIGARGFQPTAREDVFVNFSMRADENFYGTAGVIFQQSGTIREDGHFIKPFDMFGVSIIGPESSVMGQSGAVCYLALNWNPVKIMPLHVDYHTWHNYQIRLRQISDTEWEGVVFVDQARLCNMRMPSLGLLEIQVWSDNYLVTSSARRWWEMTDSTSLDYQNSGDKRFFVESIRVYAKEK